MFMTSTKELFLWIQTINQNDERDLDALYIFLDLMGGISKKELTLLKLKQKESTYLQKDLKTLKKKWLDYSQNSKPIQYVCKSTYWRNLKLELTEKVLIPRVETEQIVEIAYDILRDKEKKIIFADLGTGSGAIAISLSLLSDKWKGLATDIDEDALFVAKNNYKKITNFENLDFFCGSWWEPLQDYSEKIDIAISNPPYIPQDVYKKLPNSIKNFEPKIALHGGEDGLYHIKKIIANAPKFLKKGGWLILENHFDQSQEIKYFMREYGFNSIKTINDLFGIGRFTIGRYK